MIMILFVKNKLVVFVHMAFFFHSSKLNPQKKVEHKRKKHDDKKEESNPIYKKLDSFDDFHTIKPEKKAKYTLFNIEDQEKLISNEIANTKYIVAPKKRESDIVSLEIPVMNNTVFKCNFREHQREAYNWMVTEECLNILDSTSYNGCGILADDMGLGKTLTTLSLILSHKPQTEDCDVKTTLIVCPTSLINEWCKEIRKHTIEGKVSFYVLHGQEKTKMVKTLPTQEFISRIENVDIIITNYHTIQSVLGILKCIKFLRIILDEAHFIKNAKSKSFGSIHSLSSRFKWCLTGSPINNELDDLYSLVRWLRFQPYCNKAYWDQYIHQEEHRNKLCNDLILRRTKEILDIPPCNVVYSMVDFLKEEKILYDHIFSKAKEDIKELGNQNTRTVYYQILEKLLRVRQCCNHSFLVDRSLADITNDSENVLNNFKIQYNNNIQVKEDNEEESIDMLDSFLYTTEEDHIHTSIRNNFYLSPKIQKLFHLLHQYVFTSKDTKCVIFSQWTKMLFIIKELLYKYMNCNDRIVIQIDGSQSKEERSSIQKKFEDNENTKILLASTKACSLGLNLQVANIGFIMEPWWNPQVEKQAIDRMHRLGQKKNVLIYKFIVNDSIEEKIVNIQNRKADIVNLFLDE